MKKMLFAFVLMTMPLFALKESAQDTTAILEREEQPSTDTTVYKVVEKMPEYLSLFPSHYTSNKEKSQEAYIPHLCQHPLAVLCQHGGSVLTTARQRTDNGVAAN